MFRIVKNKKGFTLIEILIVMAIIAIIAGIVIVAVNPARQFAQARNTQRWAAVNSTLNAVHQNMIDNRGTFDFTNCNASSMPTASTTITKSGGVDICGCLVDTYMAALPVDPSDGSPTGGVTDCTAVYDTGYSIYQDSTSGRISVFAPSAELNESIKVTR